MVSSSSSLSSPPGMPLVLSMAASSALLAVLSSPLVGPASWLSLVDVSTPLPDNSVLIQGVGYWGSCFSLGPCTFASPFSSSAPPPKAEYSLASTVASPFLSAAVLSTVLPSPAHQAVAVLLALAFLASIGQHLLNAYLLFRALSQTPRTWTVNQAKSRSRRWARALGVLGGVSSAGVTVLLALSILWPYACLFGRSVDQPQGAVSLGYGSLFVILAGFLMVSGARVSEPPSSSPVSRHADPEAGVLFIQAAKMEKAWLVLDVLMEEDEEDEPGDDVEARRTSSPTYSSFHPRSRSRSPARFYLA